MEITALQNAAWRGHVADIRRLLRAGARVDERSDSGLTPLMFATKEGKTAAVRLLLDSGARVNARAPVGAAVFRGMYPIHFAVDGVGLGTPIRNCAATAQVLIDAGANPNVRDADGWTPLHYAATIPCGRILSILLKAGADPNARAREGTPLIALSRVAVPRQTWWLRAVKELLSAGADPTIPSWPDSDGSAWAIANAVWNDRLSRLLNEAKREGPRKPK